MDKMDNIGDLIRVLELEGELVRVKEEVDPELEMAEIVDRLSKQEGGGKAIIFENAKGSEISVVMNLFGSMRRMSLALGVEDIEDITREIRSILNLKPPKGIMEGIRLFPKYGQFFLNRPRLSEGGGKCQEVVEEGEGVDLGKLPILKCWPGDGGKYITLSVVMTRDLKTKRLNAGMYRLQVYDRNKTGMHWHKHHDGARHYRQYQKAKSRMEVAVVLGGPPSLIYGATAPLPPFLDELTFASFLMKKSIKMVKCKTVDLEVPSEAEIVLEGYIDPEEELRMEGPFGDHTGYYSAADLFPVFHVTAITRRKKVIYPSIIVGKPPMEDTWMGKVTERIFLPMLQIFFPEIVDINFPAFGVFHNFVFISIKKEYPYHAKKVMNGVWGLGQMMLTKFILVVEDSVDVQNMDEVLWKMANNVDPKRDVVLVEGPLDQLDHSSPNELGGWKMGFDGTTRWKGEGDMREYPEEIIMSREVKERVDRLWEKIF